MTAPLMQHLSRCRDCGVRHDGTVRGWVRHHLWALVNKLART